MTLNAKSISSCRNKEQTSTLLAKAVPPLLGSTVTLQLAFPFTRSMNLHSSLPITCIIGVLEVWLLIKMQETGWQLDPLLHMQTMSTRTSSCPPGYPKQQNIDSHFYHLGQGWSKCGSWARYDPPGYSIRPVGPLKNCHHSKKICDFLIYSYFLGHGEPFPQNGYG